MLEHLCHLNCGVSMGHDLDQSLHELCSLVHKGKNNHAHRSLLWISPSILKMSPRSLWEQGENANMTTKPTLIIGKAQLCHFIFNRHYIFYISMGVAHGEEKCSLEALRTRVAPICPFLPHIPCNGQLAFSQSHIKCYVNLAPSPSLSSQIPSRPHQ